MKEIDFNVKAGIRRIVKGADSRARFQRTSEIEGDLGEIWIQVLVSAKDNPEAAAHQVVANLHFNLQRILEGKEKSRSFQLVERVAK